MRLHIYHHFDAETFRRLDQLVELFSNLLETEHDMSAAVESVKNEVAELKTVGASTVALLGRLSQMIKENAEDPAALRAIADDLHAQRSVLADAVVANTPADSAEPTA